jgi:hypothetical protein
MEPALAEVIFPAAVSITEAKRFIYTQLEELAAETTGRCAYWIEEPSRLVFQLADETIPPSEAVLLEAGVRELIGIRPGADVVADGPVHWQTIALEFARDEGWDRARAAAWVQRRLGARDLGRTARLDAAHRLHPHLCAFLSHLAFSGGYREFPVHALNGCRPRVEFVAVPPLREPGKSASPSRSVPLPRKGGAGLEIDLADPRQRTRLPADVLPALPAKGLVNYAEAKAIVQALSAFAADTSREIGQTIGVVVLYPAQVALLQLLIRGTAATTLNVAIDTPEAFREREYAVVFLGLTRSHSHRAVSFGDTPETLALAMSRARSQLVLFGDPGSLARRSLWDGPVEHLDASSAARERDLISRLVQYLEGGGAYPSAFRLREG